MTPPRAPTSLTASPNGIPTKPATTTSPNLVSGAQWLSGTSQQSNIFGTWSQTTAAKSTTPATAVFTPACYAISNASSASNSLALPLRRSRGGYLFPPNATEPVQPIMMFGSQKQTPPILPAFGEAQPAQSGSLFGSQPPLFGSQPSQPQTSIFGKEHGPTASLLLTTLPPSTSPPPPPLFCPPFKYVAPCRLVSETAVSPPSFHPWFDGDMAIHTFTAAPEFSHSSLEEHRWNHMNQRGNVLPVFIGGGMSSPTLQVDLQPKLDIPLSELIDEIRLLECRAEVVCKLFSWDLLFKLHSSWLEGPDTSNDNSALCPKGELAVKVCEMVAAGIKPKYVQECLMQSPAPSWELTRGLTTATKHGYIFTVMRLLKNCKWTSVDGTEALTQAVLHKRWDIFEAIASSSASFNMAELLLGCADSPEALDFLLKNPKFVSPEVIQALAAARPDLISTIMKYPSCHNSCLRGIACRSNISTLFDTCLPLLGNEDDIAEASNSKESEQNAITTGNVLVECLGVAVSRGIASTVELISSKLSSFPSKHPFAYTELLSSIESVYKAACSQHPEFTPILACILPLPRVFPISIGNLVNNLEDRLASIVSSLLHHYNLPRLPSDSLPVSLLLQAIDIGSPQLLQMLLDLGVPPNDPLKIDCPLLYLMHSKNSGIPALYYTLLHRGAKFHPKNKYYSAAGVANLLPEPQNVFFYYATNSLSLTPEVAEVLAHYYDPFECRPSDSMNPIDCALLFWHEVFGPTANFLLAITGAGFDAQLINTMKAVILMHKCPSGGTKDFISAYRRAGQVKFLAFLCGRTMQKPPGYLHQIPLDVWQQIHDALKTTYKQDKDLALIISQCPRDSVATNF
ncbi:hypothetical protein Pelo_7403 [Pelomyxa schiedti]|nr:hypothetical protein Pelo_7403 [Pelomyxa schiedti]